MSLRTLFASPATRTLSRSRPAFIATRFTSSDSTSKEVEQVEQRTATAIDTVRPAGDVVAAGPVSGAPDQLLVRPVRIFRPAPVSNLSILAFL